MSQVTVTDAAKDLIKQLKAQHGNLIFVHSEGCCEGTSPMCMPADDFYVGSQYDQVGEVVGIPYYMHHSNIDYWLHLQLIIDVCDGIGNSFSLESTKDKTFILRSEVLS